MGGKHSLPVHVDNRTNDKSPSKVYISKTGFKADKNRHNGHGSPDQEESEEVISPMKIRQHKLKELQEARPELSEKQSEIVTTTWAIIKQQQQESDSEIGVSVFDRMFESYPDVKGAFGSLRSMNSADKQYTDELRAHGQRVLGTLELVITHKDDPEYVINHLHELGHKHVTFDAKVEFMDLISQMFLFAVEPVLNEHWNSEVEQAWALLFRFIIHLMKESMML